MIVEGVQLVRQGQIVEAVPAPLEKFMTEEAPPLPGDPRFNSRVSRMPGRDAPSQKDARPEGHSRKTGPKPQPRTPLQKAPDSETKPQQPATSPAGKQPR